MTSQWRKPDAVEAAQGYIAMLRETYFCMNGRAETLPPFIEIGQKERAA